MTKAQGMLGKDFSLYTKNKANFIIDWNNGQSIIVLMEGIFQCKKLKHAWSDLIHMKEGDHSLYSHE